MIRHIVLWTLNNPADAPRFKALLDSCARLVPGIVEFDVGIREVGLEANADVVLVSTFSDPAALDAAIAAAHKAQQSSRRKRRKLKRRPFRIRQRDPAHAALIASCPARRRQPCAADGSDRPQAAARW